MKSLKARLLAIVAVALIPALAIQAYTEMDARQVRQQLMQDEALRLVRLVSSEQERIVEGAEQALDVMGGTPAIQDNLPSLCERALVNLVRASPRYANAVVVGLDGRVRCALDPAMIDVDLSDRPWFQDAIRMGGVAIGTYQVNRTSARQTLPIGKAFRDSSGALGGVVVLLLDLKWMGAQLNHIPLPPGGTVWIADRDGIVLAGTGGADRLVGTELPAERQSMLHGTEATVATITGPDGREYLAAFEPPDANQAGLGIELGLDPARSFAAVARDSVIGFWLIGASGVLALLLTAYLGNRLIGRPIGRLLDATAHWRSGALATRVQIANDGTELGRLGRALDEMVLALEERERALVTALESTTDYILVMGRDDRIIYINGNAKALLGDRVAVGRLLWDVLPTWRDAQIEAAYRTAKEDRQSARVETWRSSLGREWEISFYPSERGVTVYARNITEQQQIANALRESEARMLLAQEAAGFGVWDRNFATGEIVWSDHNWVLFGRPREATAPTFDALCQWVHSDDRDSFRAATVDALKKPNTRFSNEYRVIWPDGSEHVLQSKAMILRDAEDRPVRMVGLNMDVTTLRHNEAAMRRLSEDLELRVREEIAAREAAQARALQGERLQALGQLAGGIAHDFNNVLQAVAGAMNLIDRRAGNAEATRRLVRLVMEATDRGASITQRLLAFGRRGELKSEPVDIADLLRGLHEMLSHTLGTGVTVEVELADDLPPVNTDRRQLETALVNLATNARDAMSGAGRLTMAASIEEVTGARAVAPGRYVRLTIADTGSGMDPETLARAHEPFFTTKQHGAGTGLGLPMVQNFVEESGGAMDIQSRPGEGTSVTIWLPVADVPVEAHGRPVAVAHRAHRAHQAARVLLVDDETMIRDTIDELLRDAGYAVSTASSGAAALALLNGAVGIDLLVTDLSMPEMNGLEVIRAVRDRFPEIPVILLTGFATDEAALSLAQIGGIVALLRKPVRDVELLDRIAAMLAADRAPVA